MKDSEQSTSIKLISLNVENSYHLDHALPFLRRELPGVATIQELNEKDIPLRRMRFQM
ncbi:MAG: hypothetical protein UY44_C0015G0003 [Candidatus Kaiserbacteria bacterium GW2011_GWA2_49_19]|uniref:Uncharacterized protein n=1 Tax=Candidatus Kaiserbacteria bacterium GW2011_GWA2_49_19 TaxID=1618669 RepID=A0A0G1XZX1_9BACT|nr:MAG: hypothetical protein UY44_C0015G0003 [Candidatus Kaiserbacteria bacterium GW2011_GWA2_49_19]